MSHTDINNNDWVAKLPAAFRPYARVMRLDRPIGTWLLLLPGWWSISLACGGVRYFDANIAKTFILFAVGAVVMRGAGCIVNDLWDRKFDASVERTRMRPIASGEISPVRALAFLACLLLLGLGILLQLSLVTILLGFISIPFIAVYPLMKRWTWWPQAMLGLTFNFGALMGWSAVSGTLALPPLLMYASGFFWTLGYDTIYAHQDKEDDALVGIKSTALLFREKSRKWVAIFYGISATGLLLTGLVAGKGWLYPVLMIPALAHLFRQVSGWDINDPGDCLKRFRSNRDFGLLVMAALLFA